MFPAYRIRNAAMHAIGRRCEQTSAVCPSLRSANVTSVILPMQRLFGNRFHRALGAGAMMLAQGLTPSRLIQIDPDLYADRIRQLARQPPV